MLALQEYLRGGKTCDDLTAELSVMVYHHPYLPLTGFKYNQIDSPRTHPIVLECRGIVLERGSWNLVAKGFNRFFNVSEQLEENKKFDWADFTLTEKVDGSLMIVYHYYGEWCVNTSGSFGFGLVGESGKTWQELFWETSGLDRNDLDPDYAYVFELCTKWNKVVRDYGAGKVFLLSVFYKEHEFSVECVDDLFEVIGNNSFVERPERFSCEDDATIKNLLCNKSKADVTWEGVVLRDRNNFRMKDKTDTYVALHHLRGEGFTTKRLVTLILNTEIEEVLVYFPEFSEEINKVKNQLDIWWGELCSLYEESKAIANQKEFALYIIPRTKFAGILFTVRKHGGDETMLRKLWGSNPEKLAEKMK